MVKKRPLNEGYQPLKGDNQPTAIPPRGPAGGIAQGGYQPTTSEAKPAQVVPPKKP